MLRPAAPLSLWCVLLLALAPEGARAASPRTTVYVAQLETVRAGALEVRSTLTPEDPFREGVEAAVRAQAGRNFGFGGELVLKRVATLGSSRGQPAAVVFILFAAPLRGMSMAGPAEGEVLVYSVAQMGSALIGKAGGLSPGTVSVQPMASELAPVDSYLVRMRVEPAKTWVSVGGQSVPAVEWTGDLAPKPYEVVTENFGGPTSLFPPDVLKVRPKVTPGLRARP